jgi:HEAT repeat protein
MAGALHDDAYDTKLKADLARAATSKEKSVMLVAVGAERRPENAAVLRAYARDADPSVRASTAEALRGTDGAEVRATLQDLLRDASPSVEAAALGALDQRPLAASDIRGVADAVTSGATVSANDATLVSFLAKHPDDTPDVRRTLLFLLQRTRDPQLAARIRYVLGQLEG